MGVVLACGHCGREVMSGLRGRRRKFCNDRCRLASHRRRGGRRLAIAPPAGSQHGHAPKPGGLAGWAAWVEQAYVIDRTGQELLRLLVEADVRYCQARDVLNAEGLTRTLADGRVTQRPEVAIERDTRAAIQRLITQLDLEDQRDEQTLPTDDSAIRFPRRA